MKTRDLGWGRACPNLAFDLRAEEVNTRLGPIKNPHNLLNISNHSAGPHVAQLLSHRFGADFELGFLQSE